jgi:hypothetical protein
MTDTVVLPAISTNAQRFAFYASERTTCVTLPKINATSRSAKSHGVSYSCLGTALFYAVLECRVSKVRHLLRNVSRNICNDLGDNLLMTALQITDDDKRKTIFDYLLKKGVDVSFRHRASGRDVLGMGCALGHEDQVQRILDSSMGEIDITRGDNTGLTPLHLAVQGGHKAVVIQLLDAMERYQLPVDIPDYKGITPYMYARRLGMKSIARLLVEKDNACVHRRDNATFRSADDWENLGLQEEVGRKRQELKRHMIQYKIKGVLPPVHEMRKTQADPNRSKSPSRTPRGQKVTSLVALNDEIKRMSPGKKSLLGKSVDTAFTLLGLKAEDSMVHATHFVGSELDTTKDNETGGGLPGLSTMGQLCEMMHILSDQQSSSFRRVAVKPKTPPVMKKPKAKVSTLAILMAKEKRRKQGARSKKKASPMAAKKADAQSSEKKKAKIAAARMHLAPDAQNRKKSDARG